MKPGKRVRLMSKKIQPMTVEQYADKMLTQWASVLRHGGNNK